MMVHTGVSLQNLIQAASLCYAYPTLHSLKVRHSRRSATSSVFALGSHSFNFNIPLPLSSLKSQHSRNDSISLRGGPGESCQIVLKSHVGSICVKRVVAIKEGWKL